MSNYIVGLTGGIGSGKTTVTNMFIELGVQVVDADIVAREVVAVGSTALACISEHFGAEFIQGDGQLNRSLLRSRVFSCADDKLWLNNLLHPLIRQSIITQLAQATSPYCLLVAPLLFENKLQRLVNTTLVVDVSEQTQITRTLVRDKSSKQEVETIIASQINRSDRLNAADNVIDNENTSLIQVKQQVLALHQYYLQQIK